MTIPLHKSKPQNIFISRIRHATGEPKKKNGIKKDISKSYNQFKEFEGKKYTGMKVGKS
ncbi:MAG: hypothetical protein QN651_02765 [Nitrososphaeraceae archaeon]|nr:hypothetical protein [Nitrososphaeraceae archaeon]MDW0329699.1 hypothetical protein [Nitrososphaeraceae archaeon]